MITTYDQAKKLLQIGYPSPVPPKEIQPKDIQGNLMFPIRETDDFQVLISQALQWIRDEKGVVCAVFVDDCHKYYGVQIKRYIRYVVTEPFDTHPLAESTLLDAVLNYLIKKKDEV